MTDVAGKGDFFDGTNGYTTKEYYYDKNGNIWLYRNKKMKTLYNYLNLPSRISDTITPANKIEYVYTSAGEKLKQRLSSGTTLLYFGNYVYTLDGTANGIAVKYILTQEGRATNSAGAYTYEYFMKDHLGNTRVSFNVPSTTAVIVQQSDYYPFGMIHQPQPATTSDNRYLYNGKEFQNNLLGGVNLDLYDYSRRYYDPQIGRWYVIDPKSELARRWSLYVYTMDNPIGFIDPDGMEIRLPGEKKAQEAYLTMLYNSTGNIYKIQDDKLSFVGTDVNFKGTKSKTLITTIQKGMDSKDVYTLSLVGATKDDKGVFVDSYAEKKIDISDMKKLGEVSSAFQGAAIGHFLNEVQESGGFDPAHKASLGVEGRIYGEMIGDNTITTRTDQTSEVSSGYQTVTYQYNTANKFEILQGAKATGKYETIKIGGVEFKAPVYESTGELKSVKKLP